MDKTEKKPKKVREEKPKEAAASPEQFDADFKHRVRVSGVVLEGNQSVTTAITKIKGIGLQMAKKVSSILNFEKGRKLGTLSDKEIEKIEETLSNLSKHVPPHMMNRRSNIETGENLHLIGPELDMAQRGDIDRHKKMRSYKGMRHSFGLPVRGQRTRSTFRHGPAVGVSRKKQLAAAAAAKAEKKE
ncbi:MAG: 30S ribosomal protein S13 [Candidatus Altiarchaeota archaeon]